MTKSKIKFKTFKFFIELKKKTNYVNIQNYQNYARRTKKERISRSKKINNFSVGECNILLMIVQALEVKQVN